MARETVADLRARIAALEEENARLLAERPATPPAEPEVVIRVREPVPRSQRWRNPVAAVLVVLGLVLTPVAIAIGFAERTLTDTDRFVTAFAPLATNEAVQAAVTDAVVTAIETNVDFDGITDQIVSGLAGLGLPPLATEGLRLLQGPIVDGILSLARNVVTGVVTSDAFASVWREALRITHEQLNQALSGGPRALIAVGDDDLAIDLGPVVAAVKERLLEQDIGFASFIPDDVEVTITIAEVHGIGQVKTAYALVVALGVWVPAFTALLLVAGIAIARRRTKWVLGIGISLAGLMITLGVGIWIGRVILGAGSLRGDAVDAILDAALGGLASTITAVGILGGLLAIGAGVVLLLPRFRRPVAPAAAP